GNATLGANTLHTYTIEDNDAGIIDVYTYTELRDAIKTQAGPGDIIRVNPGTYVMTDTGGRITFTNAGTPGNPITIQGVMTGSQRPILEPDTGIEINRGYFTLFGDDSDWVIENLEFRNCRGLNVLQPPNAGGIYYTSDRITLRNCYFHDSDQGITSATGAGDNLVEYCEVYNCGSDLNYGYTHGVYINDDSVTVRGCYVHDGYGGMLFKNRSIHHVLEYNWLENDGSEAFVANIASGNANNSLWVGNVFIKRVGGSTQRRILSFDDGAGLAGTVTLINNTVISVDAADIYIASASTCTADLHLKNNIFAGTSDDLLDWQGSGTISGNNNCFRTGMAAEVPAGVIDSVFTNDPGFVNLPARDLHLTFGSDCVNAGLNAPTYLDETSQWVDGTPGYEATKLLALDVRPSDATLDIGAYEWAGAVVPSVEFDLTASNGDESVTPASLSVSLSEPTTQTVTVDYAVTGGDATGGGTDYTLAAGTLTFDPNDLTKTVDITIVDDGLMESDETIEVTLSNPGNGTLGTNTVHTYTILDNDVGTGTGLTGAYYDNIDFTAFALSRVDATVNFNWGTGSPDPSIGVDTFSIRWVGQVQPLYSETYTFYTNTDDGVRLWVDNQLVIDHWVDQGPTEWSGTIALLAGVKYDIEMEYYENGGGAVAELRWSSTGQAKEIIPQPQLYPGAPPSPTVAFDLTASNGAESVTPASLAVSLSQASAQTITVDYAVTGGTATGGGVDYTLAAGTLTFDPNDVSKTIDIAIVDDGLVESDETVEVTLSNPTNATLGVNTVHTYTINDNDALPTVEFDLTASSGDESVTPASLSVSLSAAYVETVTVDYAVTGGDATGGGVDYTLAAGTLTFDPNDVSKTIAITIVEDGLVEADETIEVTLSNPSNATLGTNTVHTYTINDNDAYPTVAFDLTASNGAESVTPASLSVSLSVAYVEAVTVDYAVTGGTATGGGVDYTLAAGTLTFDPNDVAKAIDITIVDDVDIESDETVEVTLSNPTNATLGANTVHTYTINDNDVAAVVYWGGGVDLSWTTAANWQGGVLPGTGDTAVIDSGRALVDGDLAGPPAEIRIDVGGDVNINFDTTNNFTLNGGTITCNTDASPTMSGNVLLTADSTVRKIYSNNNRVLTLTGAISEDASARKLTLDGPNENCNIALSGANTYSGGTDIVGGDILANSASALGTGLVSVASGGLELGVDGDYSHGVITATAGIIMIGGDITNEVINVQNASIDHDNAPRTVDSSNTVTVSGTVNIYASGTNVNNPLVLATTITGSGHVILQESSNGRVYIRAAQSWTGDTEVNSWTVLDSVGSGSLPAGTVTVNPSEELSIYAPAVLDVLHSGGLTSGHDLVLGYDSGLGLYGTVNVTADVTVNTLTLNGVQQPAGTYTQGVDFTDYFTGASSNTITVLSGPSLPTVAFDLTASSGDESATPASLAVSLSGASAQTVTVDYAVTAGSATGGGVDYTLAAGTLTFDPNDVAKTIDITIVDDGLVEADETVEVTLSNPSNATLGTNTVHTYTINDNDLYPSVDFDLVSSSGDESVATVNLSVSLSAAYDEAVTVDFAVTGGTAVNPDDFTIAASPLTFNVGVTQQDIVVTVVDDGLVESDETIEVTLSNPSNATLGANTVHTYTINDNDVVVPAVAFDVTSSSGGEGVATVNL
ncbi:MAG TPA: Calx-beta domain-containing protein, partial [Phycisphaerae bacterium]|nr:Calx-beta domain-containing protein [Phycisphaerae bacterium]